MLVPFPFTDLSGRKRRPALVVSPEGFHEEELPKQSVVKVGNLFTTHRSLIAGRFGIVNEEKLVEVLSRLRALFAGDEGAAGAARD